MTRKIALYTNGIFHVYNRGVDKRDLFGGDKDLLRFLETLSFYRFDRKIKFSALNASTKPLSELSSEKLSDMKVVEIINYCIMPNHFHFTLRQITDDGITTFMHRLSTSYTNFFNTKYERTGALFQGTFKAVPVGTEEQLLHLSRYIHLNPMKSSHLSIRNKKELANYPWSSYPEYLGKTKKDICDKNIILDSFKNIRDYQEFINSEIDEMGIEKLEGLDIDNDFSWYDSPNRVKLGKALERAR